MTTALRTKKGYGDFGVLSENYRIARKGFPDESIAYIFKILEEKNPHILDIGCGTGIATTQLYENGARVIGTDIDAKMIQRANEKNLYKIEYHIAPAVKQPFADHTFDAVTAFSAFHWFADTETLIEMKRVLKSDGIFFVVNKNETGNFKKENKEILQRFISKAMTDIKKEYNPVHILNANGLQDVREQHFATAEYFSTDAALAYVQTMSVWNLVSSEKKGTALHALRSHFSAISNLYGVIERKLDVVVVSGRTTKW